MQCASAAALRVRIDVAVTLAGANNQVVFTLLIPNLLALVGAVVHAQAIVPDPAAGNTFGAVMSDAKTLTVGR